MRLSPGRFNNQLREMGQRLLWRRASLCPCRDPHSGGAKPDCPVCDGLHNGTFWGPAVPAWAGVVGAKARREFADFGRWEDGDVLLSIPADSPLWGAGENDRVLFADGHEPFQATLKRTAATLAPMGAHKVERCFWLGPNGAALLECAVPRVDPATRALSWPAGAPQPDPGSQFTLVGAKRPEFFFYRELPVSRAHFRGLPLPKRAVLKRFDLFGKG